MVRDSLLTFFTRMFVILGRVAYAVVINRALGPYGKGLFEVIQVVPKILQNFGLFGFEQSNVFFTGKKPKVIPNLLTNSIWLGVLLGIVSIILGLIYYNIFGEKYSSVFAIVGYPLVLAPLLITPLHLIGVYFDQIVYGTNRIWVRNLKEICRISLQLAIPIFLVIVLRWWVKGVVLGYIGLYIVLFIYSCIFILIFFKGKFGRFDRSVVKESFSFGKYEFGANFATYLFYQIDLLLLFLLLPDGNIPYLDGSWDKMVLIGFYGFGVTVITAIWTIPDSITTALKPKITIKGESERQKLVPPSLRICMITVIFAMVFLAVFIKPMVRIVCGPDWSPIGVATPIYFLMPGILTLSIAKIFATDLFSRGKPYYAMWISIFSLCVNLILNFILIPMQGPYGGIVGAAIASSVSYTISFILFCHFFRRESGHSFSTMFIPRKSDFVEIWAKIKLLAKPGTATENADGENE